MILNPLLGLSVLAFLFGAFSFVISPSQARVDMRESMFVVSALCVLVGVSLLLISQTL